MTGTYKLEIEIDRILTEDISEQTFHKELT